MLSDLRILYDVVDLTVLNLLRLVGWLVTLVGLALIVRRILITMLTLII
jgi:hypothetical protein